MRHMASPRVSAAELFDVRSSWNPELFHKSKLSTWIWRRHSLIP